MSKNKQELKIIFLGTPHFAVEALKALLDNEFNIVAVVTNIDKPSGRGMKLQASAVKEYALANDIPVLQPKNLKSPAFIQVLAAYRADVQVVVAFRMLPQMVWSMPPLGTVNIHASLLPDYRGAAPINWAIINGEKESGITTFQLKHEIDTGDILLQSKIDIEPLDNVGTLHDKLAIEGGKLIVETLNKMIDGSLEKKAQEFNDENKKAPKIFKKDTIIDWDKNASEINNFIRGMSPYPAAQTELNGTVFKIFKTEIELNNHNDEMGKVLSDNKSYIKVACNNGYINILSLQMQGKKKMNVEDFLRGNDII